MLLLHTTDAFVPFHNNILVKCSQAASELAPVCCCIKVSKFTYIRFLEHVLWLVLFDFNIDHHGSTGDSLLFTAQDARVHIKLIV